jgi:hypothetical protein
MAIDPNAVVLLQGEMEAKWQTMQVLWKKRKFAICSDLSFRRFKGEILRHSAIMTDDTTVSKVNETEFTIAFRKAGSGERWSYRIRAVSAADCDIWFKKVCHVQHYSPLAQLTRTVRHPAWLTLSFASRALRAMRPAAYLLTSARRRQLAIFNS